MNLAICIKSCQYDKSIGCHSAIRETWGRNLPDNVDLYFFMGGEQCDTDWDEKWVPVDDGYWPSMQKTRAITEFAVDENYDYIYLCDTDSYVIIKEMLKWPFEQYDYSGGHLCSRRKEDRLLGHGYGAWDTGKGDVVDPFYNYFSGGVGFFLSQKAARIVAESEYYINSEDLCVGQMMGREIAAGNIKAGVLQGIEGVSVWHLNCGFYGGGHTERKNAGEAVRRHHFDLGYGK
jgi:hypothetical protein